MKNKFKILALFSIMLCTIEFKIHALKIDQVILSSNENTMYLDFWPLVAQAWKNLIGIEPVLFLIAEEHIEVDETVGTVIRVKPIPGVSTASHAQIIRLLAPIYFEDKVSIISDIDMMPLNRSYFIDSVKTIPDNKFVVYRNLAYGEKSLRFPMCYNAGKGYLFKDIFKIKSVEDIPSTIKQWVSKGYGWETDEVILYTHVLQWEKLKTDCVFLGHTSMVSQRIDRVNWKYDKIKLKSNYYIDSHMVRPLTRYYKEIKELANAVGLIL